MTEKTDNSPRGFLGAFKEAQRMASDAAETKRILHDAELKAASKSQKIKAMSADLQSLFRLVGAWMKGTYRKAPTQTFVFALAAIIYFLNPLDVIPDYFPVLGYIDDMTIIGFVIKGIKKEIDEFLIWEKSSK